ncbi:S46 family peptidase [Aureispira sp. CCB-QB1]|uniref:S46 family peptidase n=1 Tax=Aureispira sp. CCB-QB1 TaxID=1313421 RepID=UPI000697C182|nr:S46 family peptidase [Aureispira sp. CCB-QB1]
MKNFVLLVALLFTFQSNLFAVEGMWIPSLIDMFHSDMKTYGLKLSPEEIYSTNKSSLKDAIVQFNGGCTAEIVSEEGLLFTNHHCGFSAIQRHSSLENDYLKNGFWAKSKAEELACPWLRVTFVKEIRDVTKEVLEGLTDEIVGAERGKIIMQNIAKLEAAEASDASISAKIKAFNLGNQFYMLITQDYNDIRLVGAPPSAIGKYGGDTDNWVWPRHTGDFAVFRIYADNNNNSAKHDKANVPYKPAHFLPISLKPKKEGDFTMVYGFPGSTDQHFPSEKLSFYMDVERPARIAMRQASLDLIKPAMNSSDEIRIKYASKQARIANAWKKWIGQIGGLKELNALDKKIAWEKTYREKASEKSAWTRYKNVLAELNRIQEENSNYEFARSMFIEYFYVGPEMLRFAHDFNALANNYKELEEKGKVEDEIKRLQGKAKSFFKDYDKNLDEQIFNKLTPMYIDFLNSSEFLPKGFKENWKKNGEKIYAKSMLMNLDQIESMLSKFSEKSCKKLQKDPALMMANELYNHFVSNTNPSYVGFAREEQALMKIYVEGILTMFPEKKTWADANSTMRIAYGKVEGSAPVDGMKYLHYSTMKGIMQKYDPNNPDFQLTDRFLKLYKEGDWGAYEQDGELWVCFTASNHTTGGNSGSPVIDADGNLMGINFDRSWESTMSDFMFDESRCRNIVVDARYVLWVIDKYGEAGHLIKEMKLVK